MMQRNREIDEVTASSIWDVLTNYCGARESERSPFIQHAASGTWSEYRFQGSLGFGGKVWNTRDEFRVSCYPEDMTPSRGELIEATNKRLADIYKRQRLTS